MASDCPSITMVNLGSKNRKRFYVADPAYETDAETILPWLQIQENYGYPNNALYILKIGDRFRKLLVVNREKRRLNKGNRYICLCDCGEIVSVRATHLVRHITVSCGCHHQQVLANCRSRKQGAKGNASRNKVVQKYKRSANESGRSFSLTDEQLSMLFCGNCFYCGLPPHRVASSKVTSFRFKFNGIDRVDNSKGYDFDNVVSCCYECNKAKNNTALKQFCEWINRVSINLKNKGSFAEIEFQAKCYPLRE